MEEETRRLLEETLVKEIENISNLESGTKEHQMAVNDVRALTAALNETDSTQSDWFDKQEKRRIDEEKNSKMSEIEMQKTKMDWRKVLLEGAKMVVPTLISIWGYDKFQKRLLYFEENGRVNSTAGRGLPLPKFFK